LRHERHLTEQHTERRHRGNRTGCNVWNARPGIETARFREGLFHMRFHPAHETGREFYYNRLLVGEEFIERGIMAKLVLGL